MTLRHRPWETAADFTIGLRAIPVSAWLEPGEADPATRKDALMASHPAQVWAEVAESRPAQREVLAMMDHALGTASDAGQAPPLYIAARQVHDDLCVMEKRDGVWRLTALSLCAGSFFTADDVVGRSLAELHAPVPGFGDRLLPRVERIFNGLRPDLVLERRNWTLLNSADLFTPAAEPIRAGIGAIDPAEAGDALHLRVERQTLRRLPRTGGVLFTIRVWLAPLASLRGDPTALGAFAEAWRKATPAFRAYKRLDLYDGLVSTFLDRAMRR